MEKNINSQDLNQERFKLKSGDMRPISLDEFEKLVRKDESADGDDIDGDEQGKYTYCIKRYLQIRVEPLQAGADV